MKVKSFDVEANGLLREATKMWCIVVKELGQESKKYSLAHNAHGLDDLSDADIIVGHNIINYDLPLMKNLYGWEPKKGTVIIDTYILSRTLDPDLPKPDGMGGKKGAHSLEAWGYRVGRGKPDHSEWDRFSEEMLHRCSEDVEITELVYLRLCKQGSLDYTNPFVGDSTWINALKLEQRMQEYINDIEWNGFPIDTEEVKKHLVVLTDRMSAIENELLPMIPKKPVMKGVEVSKPFKKNGEPTKTVTDWLDESDISDVAGPFSRFVWVELNLGSDSQVKEYLLSIGWKPTEYNDKKVTAKESGDPQSPYFRQVVGKPARDARGNKVKTGPKLTEDSFDSLDSDIGLKFADYLRTRHRYSLLSGLLELETGGRVSQYFTGLTSTGRYKHGGVVNIPSTSWYGHEIRSCFTTAKGFKLIGTDAASCQLRMLCHYMDDPAYTEAVVSGIEIDEETGIYHGTDIHTLNGIACGLLDVKDVEACRGKHEDWLKDNDGVRWAKVKLQRKKAKNFIYGLLFGAGPAKIAETIGCTTREAEAVMAKFMQSLPKLKKLMDGLDKVYKTRGYLIGLDGRKIVLRSPHMKLVYLLQGAEATFMKVAWCFIKESCRRRNLGVQSVCWNHDEFQELVPDEYVDEYVEIARDAFVRAGTYLKLRCPTAGSPKVGNNWGETH